jgi:hypothetical protein
VIVAYIDAHRERVVEGRRLGVEPICEIRLFAMKRGWA